MQRHLNNDHMWISYWNMFPVFTVTSHSHDDFEIWRLYEILCTAWIISTYLFLPPWLSCYPQVKILINHNKSCLSDTHGQNFALSHFVQSISFLRIPDRTISISFVGRNTSKVSLKISCFDLSPTAGIIPISEIGETETSIFSLFSHKSTMTYRKI